MSATSASSPPPSQAPSPNPHAPGPIELTVNGEPRRIAAGSTVVALLGELGLESAQVAVEQNGQVVPRRTHAETALHAGDVIEIVTFVGGG